MNKLHVTRAASIFSRWREEGDLLRVESDLAAAALVKAKHCEPADADTAERLAPILRNTTRAMLKRAAWEESQRRLNPTMDQHG